MVYLVKSLGHTVYMDRNKKHEAERVFKEVQRNAELWEVQVDGSAKLLKKSN